MDARAVESLLKGLMRGEFSSLSVSFNEHAGYRYTADRAVEDGDYDRVQWVSEEERAKAIEMNSVWMVQCYPDTPISSYTIGASTLVACLEFVSAMQAEDSQSSEGVKT